MMLLIRYWTYFGKLTQSSNCFIQRNVPVSLLLLLPFFPIPFASLSVVRLSLSHCQLMNFDHFHLRSTPVCHCQYVLYDLQYLWVYQLQCLMVFWIEKEYTLRSSCLLHLAIRRPSNFDYSLYQLWSSTWIYQLEKRMQL